MNQPDQIEHALNFVSRLSLGLIFSGMLAACDPAVESSLHPQGQEKTAKTQMLEVGATMLQTSQPANETANRR